MSKDFAAAFAASSIPSTYRYSPDPSNTPAMLCHLPSFTSVVVETAQGTSPVPFHLLAAVPLQANSILFDLPARANLQELSPLLVMVWYCLSNLPTFIHPVTVSLS